MTVEILWSRTGTEISSRPLEAIPQSVVVLLMEEMEVGAGLEVEARPVVRWLAGWERTDPATGQPGPVTEPGLSWGWSSGSESDQERGREEGWG